MNLWAMFWLGLLGFTFVSFGAVALWVTFRGIGDIRALIAHLAAEPEEKEDPS
jgi:cyanate permease